MNALSLDHYNVYCKDLAASVHFYERYVGLRIGDRPPLPFPGAWLYADDKAVLHLIAESGRQDEGSGAIDHVSINCSGIRSAIDRIKADNLPVDVRLVPGMQLQQVFIRDPDGVLIELNFRDEPQVEELANFDAATEDPRKRERPGSRSASRG
ncbi:VOC family protein [Ramlibacter sp.]|uniref:VOC family protein n=1 Tax=Ramlibacter sp. TaxID=1917967 RepID=UPI003D11512F